MDLVLLLLFREPLFYAGAGNNMIYGARVSHQTPGLYQIGVSALREEKNDSWFREEEGVDVWFRPVNSVQLVGRSSYDSIGDQWMEHAYHLLLGLLQKMTFDTEASNYHYASYFRGTTTPALQFIAGVLDPNETATILREEIPVRRATGLPFSRITVSMTIKSRGMLHRMEDA